jgi:hypothetical protein
MEETYRSQRYIVGDVSVENVGSINTHTRASDKNVWFVIASHLSRFELHAFTTRLIELLQYINICYTTIVDY